MSKRDEKQVFHSDNFFSKNRKGQITIFIIVGIIIVVAVGLFLVLRGNVVPSIGGGKEINPESYMETCIEDDLRVMLNTLSMQGGYIENSLNKNFKFEGEEQSWEISYLCYNQNYYDKCVNQESLLIQHLTQEIEQEISGKVGECFDSLLTSLDKKNYEVDVKGSENFKVQLQNGKVNFISDVELNITKNEETSTKEGIEFSVASKIYDLGIVVNDIVSEEAKNCIFDQVVYMTTHPEFSIEKIKTGDSIVYKVIHRNSEERFQFAIRGCVIPPIS